MTVTVFTDGAKACIGFDLNGVGVSVCLHFEMTSPQTQDYIDLAAAVAAEWADHMLASQSNDLTMADVTVYDLSAESAPKYINSDENGSPGTDATDAAPNNSAVIVSHRTTQTGRSGRGRTYVPGISETDVVDGLLSTAYVNEVTTNWGLFITGVETATSWEFVVAQRWADGVQLTTGVMREVVTEIITRHIGTQRRRQVPSGV